MEPLKHCVIATRESPLAMWQALHIQARLRAEYPGAAVDLLGMTTKGDQILDRTLSKVGGKASQAAVDGTANTAALAYATQTRSSVSQVNLDEEASNLVKFQQYYTASSQIIKAAQETFSTLINSL